MTLNSTALQCEFCDKGFSDKSKLKRHVSSVHEGKRPHKCDICGACFTQKSHMDGHVATVHGKKSAENQIKGTLFFQKVSRYFNFFTLMSGINITLGLLIS